MRANSARSPARAAATDARARFCSWRFGSLSFSCSHRKVAIADRNAPRLQRGLRERLRAPQPLARRAERLQHLQRLVGDRRREQRAQRDVHDRRRRRILLDLGVRARRSSTSRASASSGPRRSGARVRLDLLERDVAADGVVAVRRRAQHRRPRRPRVPRADEPFGEQQRQRPARRRVDLAAPARRGPRASSSSGFDVGSATAASAAASTHARRARPASDSRRGQLLEPRRAARRRRRASPRPMLSTAVCTSSSGVAGCSGGQQLGRRRHQRHLGLARGARWAARRPSRLGVGRRAAADDDRHRQLVGPALGLDRPDHLSPGDARLEVLPPTDAAAAGRAFARQPHALDLREPAQAVPRIATAARSLRRLRGTVASGSQRSSASSSDQKSSARVGLAALAIGEPGQRRVRGRRDRPARPRRRSRPAARRASPPPARRRRAAGRSTGRDCSRLPTRRRTRARRRPAGDGALHSVPPTPSDGSVPQTETALARTILALEHDGGVDARERLGRQEHEQAQARRRPTARRRRRGRAGRRGGTPAARSGSRRPARRPSACRSRSSSARPASISQAGAWLSGSAPSVCLDPLRLGVERAPVVRRPAARRRSTRAGSR